jgi:hypothetical protein
VHIDPKNLDERKEVEKVFFTFKPVFQDPKGQAQEDPCGDFGPDLESYFASKDGQGPQGNRGPGRGLRFLEPLPKNQKGGQDASDIDQGQEAITPKGEKSIEENLVEPVNIQEGVIGASEGKDFPGEDLAVLNHPLTTLEVVAKIEIGDFS